MTNEIYEQIGVAMTCRSFEEYCRMFDLQSSDLERGVILDVAGGGSSFTAEARAQGFEAYAADPRYEGDLKAWIYEAAEEIATSTAKLAGLMEQFDWSYYGSLENHREGRELSLVRFSNHVRSKEGQGCYTAASLPKLQLENNAYNLILCSHFLFLYAEQFGYEFHEQSVTELIRVCKPGGQIRIYPLISLHWKPYPHLERLIAHIRGLGCEASLLETKLPFIQSSTHYLKIVKRN